VLFALEAGDEDVVARIVAEHIATARESVLDHVRRQPETTQAAS
jgi:DNA-binding GntR family transcriptional regulator